jgi:hypothetical protein
VAVHLGRKFAANEQEVRDHERIRHAMRDGHRFGNFVEALFWPQHEVQRFLKGRSRGLSLHSPDDGILKQTKTCVIYSVHRRATSSRTRYARRQGGTRS